MVSAWEYDSNSDADPRESHQKSPNVSVGLEELEKIGVLHWKFDISSNYEEKVSELMAVNFFILNF